MDNQNISEFDSPWKEALDAYFPEFMEFFFPDAFAEIDWNKGYETLDKELQKVVQDANLGKRLADKLVKVRLKNNQETIILIHTEIQGQYETDFAKRMFIYHYRIFDKYIDKNTEIISLAVLGDEEPNWQPSQYSHSRFGCRVTFDFPIIKLLNYQDRLNQLENNPNPFAMVCLAYLQSKETSRNPEARLKSKLRLIKSLYQRGYSREMIIQLFRLIDWMMILPGEFKKQFETELSNFEEELKMPYITSIEQSGIEKGNLARAKKSIFLVLEAKFVNIPENIRNSLKNIDDIDTLENLLQEAVKIMSLEDFDNLLPQKK